MGDISKNFWRSEFTCNCGCGQDTIDVELITVLQRLRDHYKVPVTCNSGNRCVEYNEVVQKAFKPNYVPYSSRSTHMESKASDTEVAGIKPSKVYKLLDKWYPGRFGLGNYTTFTHIDVRRIRARW